jgi:hypothetical protein
MESFPISETAEKDEKSLLKKRKKIFTYSLEKSSNLCFRLTYTIVLFDNILYHNSNRDSVLLLFSTNMNTNNMLTQEEENELLLNHMFFRIDYVPLSLIISTFFFFIIFIISFFLKKRIAIYLEQNVFREQIDLRNPDFFLIDSTITALPVKNYMFSSLKSEIRLYSQKEIFISYNDYKLFFYQMFKKYPGLQEIVNKTLIQRNQFKAQIIISIFLIVISIILSILTNKVIAHLNFDVNSKKSIIMVFFSILYMSILIFEFLNLISNIDNKKFLSSRILTPYEKKFLEEEFENEQE